MKFYMNSTKNRIDFGLSTNPKIQRKWKQKFRKEDVFQETLHIYLRRNQIKLGLKLKCFLDISH